MNKRLYSLEEIKKRLASTAEQYGVEKAYVFGSYARGEATPESDVDICIEKGKIRTLFELSGFYLDLQEALDKNVDVVTNSSLSGNFKDRVEHEMILVYG